MRDLSQFKKKQHIEIQTKYVSLLVVGSFALVGIVFGLGVIVGTKKVPQTVCATPDPLAALDESAGEPWAPKPKEMTPNTFHKTLQTNTSSVPTPATLLADGKGGQQAEAFSKQELNSVDLLQPRHSEQPIPEKVLDSESGIYSLQVGSYQDQREASLMAKRLKQAGHRAFLVGVNMPERGGMWYRVRIGPFESKKVAWRYKDKLEKTEKMPSFVVKRTIKS